MAIFGFRKHDSIGYFQFKLEILLDFYKDEPNVAKCTCFNVVYF